MVRTVYKSTCPLLYARCIKEQYLSYPMGSIHSLKVPHGVPVMFNKHHGVCTGQVQAQTSNMGGQQQHINGWVIVKPKIQREESQGKELDITFTVTGSNRWSSEPSGYYVTQSPDLETMECRRPAGTLPSSLR